MGTSRLGHEAAPAGMTQIDRSGELTGPREPPVRPAPIRAPTRATARPVLIVPGLYNSGPDHWQSYWQREFPNTARVEQLDWDFPTLGDWVAGLVEAVRRHPGAVLVGHSLGCALIAHVARLRGSRDIGGAMLVAPADVDRERPAERLATPVGCRGRPWPLPKAPALPSVYPKKCPVPLFRFAAFVTKNCIEPKAPRSGLNLSIGASSSCLSFGFVFVK